MEPSLGKVRRGETINVDAYTHGHRGNSLGELHVYGDWLAAFTITCYPLLSNINYQGGVSSTLSSCSLLGHLDRGPSLSAQWIDNFSSYIIEFQASVPADAQDGDVTGSIHIEIAYE